LLRRTGFETRVKVPLDALPGQAQWFARGPSRLSPSPNAGSALQINEVRPVGSPTTAGTARASERRPRAVATEHKPGTWTSSIAARAALSAIVLLAAFAVGAWIVLRRYRAS